VQGDARVLDLLNDVLTAELTAINQYFLDAKMFANWGIDGLAKKFHEDSIDEMKDADELIERILFLDGVPNVQRLGAVRIGETPVEKLRLALDVEREAVGRLRAGIDLCTELGDHGSRHLLEDILRGEEEHADWLETQLDLVDRLGEQLYLSTQTEE
jgi:bacterioferritin